MDLNTLFIIFGFVGSGIGVVINLPQVILTMKKETMEDISIFSIALDCTSQLFLICYSSYFKLYPIIGAAVSMFLCDAVLICCYINYKNKNIIINNQLIT